MPNIEIEAKFLEIDKTSMTKQIISLGAEDKGEVMLEEIILYDKALSWINERKFIRIRKRGEKIVLSYKHHDEMDKGQSTEIQIKIDDIENAIKIFEKLGLVLYRKQQKFRHTFILGDVTFDIDTWPNIPTYLEIEGPSLDKIKGIAKKLHLDWEKAVLKDAAWVLENIYGLQIKTMRDFTFKK